MKNPRLLALAAAVLALAACSGPPTPAYDRAADEAEILAMLDSIAGSFKTGDMDKVLDVYADDVLVLGIDQPDVAGKEAWRKVLAEQPSDVTIDVRMDTEELEIVGDLAYERGTYTATISSKETGALLQTVTNRHIHIFKRQPDGHWKAWRLMENATSPARPGSPAAPQAEPAANWPLAGARPPLSRGARGSISESRPRATANNRARSTAVRATAASRDV